MEQQQTEGLQALYARMGDYLAQQGVSIREQAQALGISANTYSSRRKDDRYNVTDGMIQELWAAFPGKLEGFPEKPPFQ